MPIKAFCGNCGTTLQAKDSLAGKRVKCPKCASPITVGESLVAGAAASSAKPAAQGTAGFNPMLDLLDEANVKAAVRGPLCPNCSAEMKKGAIICLDCGFNIETGQRIRRVNQVDGDDEFAGMSETDKMLARAERDIDDMPITGVGQDFGDGGESFIIALVAGGIMALLIGIGMAIVLSMETLTKQLINPAGMSFIASTVLALAMIVWISIVALKQKAVVHAVAGVLTAGLWCIVYGFLQGRQLIIPTIILLVSLVIGGASGAYVYYNGMAPIQEEVR